MSTPLPIDGPRLIQIKDLIEQHFGATEWEELGILTGESSVIDRHARLLRSMSFGDDDYGGCILSVLQTLLRANPENADTIERYIAKKCKPKAETDKSRDGNGGAANNFMTITPKVFQVPDVAVNSKLVSVMIPYRAEFAAVMDAIRGAAQDVDCECLRAKDFWEHSMVLQDVFSLIYRSQIVVCDFSGQNPNVFYEAGIAHTLGRDVIPIAQSDNDIPSDMKPFKYVTYLNNREGLRGLRQALTDRIKTLIRASRTASW